MNIVVALPPNYEELCEHFDIRHRRNIVFTWGSDLYVPSGGAVSDDLMVHEQVHERQQAKQGPALWWEHYIADANFRFTQEVEAYREQFAFICDHALRNERRVRLRQIASDLASPIYRLGITEDQARYYIQDLH